MSPISRVPGNLPGQFGVLAGHRQRKVGRSGACSRVCPAHDPVQEHVTGPASGQGLSDVPVPDGRLIELVKDDHEVTPGHCAAGCCTNAGGAGHASARRRMWCKLRRETPLLSGKANERSTASWSTTMAPQPSALWMAFPMAQYSSMSAVLTTRAAVHCVDRIWAFSPTAVDDHPHTGR